MASVTDIILAKGMAIVRKADSLLGLVGVGDGLNFGTVQNVADTADGITIGQNVMFPVEQSKPFMVISGVTFYLVKISDLSFTETTPP